MIVYTLTNRRYYILKNSLGFLIFSKWGRVGSKRHKTLGKAISDIHLLSPI